MCRHFAVSIEISLLNLFPVLHWIISLLGQGKMVIISMWVNSFNIFTSIDCILNSYLVNMHLWPQIDHRKHRYGIIVTDASISAETWHKGQIFWGSMCSIAFEHEKQCIIFPWTFFIKVKAFIWSGWEFLGSIQLCLIFIWFGSHCNAIWISCLAGEYLGWSVLLGT